MTEQSTTVPTPLAGDGGRILILGNSFLGAVMKALQADPSLAAGYRFDFAARGNGSIRQMLVADGRIANVIQFAGMTLLPFDSYDHIYVYAMFPHVYAINDQRLQAQRAGYSAQVIDAATEDMMRAADGQWIHDLIRPSVTGPIHILSGNIPSNVAKPIGADNFDRANATIARFAGRGYHPVPRDLLTPDLMPDIHVYKGSIDIRGNTQDGNHDVHHFNAAGGAIIVRSIVERAALADRPARVDHEALIGAS